MIDPLQFMHVSRRRGQACSLVLLVVGLLIAIRLVAGFVCMTCFIDFERPQSRSFHLHAGGDLNPCHHGRVAANPLTNWACAVTQDDVAFILPVVPRLPIISALFVPLVLLAISYRNAELITAHGRGPPLFFS